MRAFKFRLQSLQRIREHARDAAKRELAGALQRQAECIERQTDLQYQLQGLEGHMRSAVKQTQLDVDRVMDGHRHQISLQMRLAELDEVISQAGQEVERCRLKLIDADREVKVLEKLHERQLADHNRQLVAAEAKQLDEAASLRAVRQA